MPRVTFVCALVWLLAACQPGASPPPDANIDLARSGLRYLGADGSDDGFARALEPRELFFPADHGEHPEYRSEWWYFTGNVNSRDGRRFGFQLTFFRFGLEPPGGDRSGASAWRAGEVWMAHFAMTDAAGRRFFADERLARGALGMAGASATPLRVWVKDWSVDAVTDEAGVHWRLAARDGSRGLNLRLSSGSAPIANGERGLDRKGPEPGNASFYYSMPRLAVAGDVTMEGEVVAVEGLAWLDREWSTSALSPGIVGWDWFALQLADGGSLMVYRLRTADGGASPFSGGNLVSADGTQMRLDADDAELSAFRHWTSPASGRRYPVEWRLRIPRAAIDLRIRPVIDDQELDLSVRYWEGAVDAAGTGPSGPLEGRGYLELTGY